jgi:hypothetical protein
MHAKRVHLGGGVVGCRHRAEQNGEQTKDKAQLHDELGFVAARLHGRLPYRLNQRTDNHDAGLRLRRVSRASMFRAAIAISLFVAAAIEASQRNKVGRRWLVLVGG